MKRSSFYIFILTILLAGLSGCYKLDGSSVERRVINVNGTDTAGEAVKISITTPALLQQVIPNRTSPSYIESDRSTRSASSSRGVNIVQYLSGTLTVKEGGSTVGSYSVTASVDEASWNAQLLQTLVLAPGNYSFDLLLTKAGQQYIGTTSGTISAEQENDISMTIYPIIGNTVVNTEVLTELGSFKFYYSEIPGLEGFDPKLGVIIDSTGDEQVFDISSDTGMTEAYLNLTTGTHTIELKLYDGVQQKGRSIPSQETQTITAGQNLTMDLAPIYGETVYSMSAGGADASFDITIPSEIVTEAGGLSNLRVPYIINGPGTDYTPQEGQITQITMDASGDYLGELDLSGAFYYATVYIYISFYKDAEDELIGTCNVQSRLDTQERTAMCGIPVTNSLISSGKLLGTVGVTVCEEDASGDCGTFMGGATVYDVSHDEYLGLTGSGTEFSTGYLRTDLTAGDYTIRATASDGRFGETAFSLAGLEVKNVEIILNASAPTNPGLAINGGDAFTLSEYVTLNLSAEDTNGISAYYASNSSTAPGDDDWITVSPSTSFSANTAFQLTSGTGLKTVYAWYRNLAGHVSERVSDTITVQDDTSLYYSNFLFTTSETSSPDSQCTGDYRIADYQEVATLVNGGSATTGDFINDGNLSPSTGTSFFGTWFGSAPTGAYVSYNGNTNLSGSYYAISVYSNPSRDIYFGWTPHSEPYLGTNPDDLQLYTVNGDTAYTLCYRDSGVHPLMNGDFSSEMDYWDPISGSSDVLSNALVLQTNDSTADAVSRVEQSKIAVSSSTSYLIAFKAKTSDILLTLTAGVTGAQVTDATYDALPYTWNEYSDRIEMSGESTDSGDNYYFDINMTITTDSTADELTIYYEFENSGTSGQSATIDNVTLTEL